MRVCVWDEKRRLLAAYGSVVAGGGFEPPASRLWAWRATGLLHPAMGRIFRLDNYILGLGSYQVFFLFPANRLEQLHGLEDGVVHVEVAVIGEPAEEIYAFFFAG